MVTGCQRLQRHQYRARPDLSGALTFLFRTYGYEDPYDREYHDRAGHTFVLDILE
jgi:hypothetical protein